MILNNEDVHHIMSFLTIKELIRFAKINKITLRLIQQFLRLQINKIKYSSTNKHGTCKTTKKEILNLSVLTHNYSNMDWIKLFFHLGKNTFSILSNEYYKYNTYKYNQSTHINIYTKWNSISIIFNKCYNFELELWYHKNNLERLDYPAHIRWDNKKPYYQVWYKNNRIVKCKVYDKITV